MAYRIGRSITASYLRWVVGIASPLVMVPLLVRTLGHDLYGQWIVILSVTSYLGLANLGTGQTVGNRVAEASATGNASQIGVVVSTAFLFYSMIAGLILAMCGVLWLLGLARVVPLRLHSAEVALGALLCLGALSLPFTVHRMALRGLHRVDLEQALSVAFDVARVIAVAVLAVMGFRLVPIAIVQGGAILATGIAIYVVLRGRHPEVRPRLSRFSTATLRGMLRPSAAFFTLQVASALVFGVDNLVIGYTLGAKAVTQYAVPFQLVLITSGMFSVALAALMPAVTAHNAVGDRETLSAGYLLFVRVALVFAAGACLCLWLGGRSLLDHWAGAGVFPGYATFGMQLALLFVQVLLAPGDAILVATSRHYVYAALAAIEGVLNLALSLWWVRIWGLPGVIAGTVAARLLTNGWYIPVAAANVAGLGACQSARGAGRTATVSIAAAAMIAFWLAPWSMSPDAGAIAVACGAGVAFLMLSVGFGLTRSERLWTLQKIGDLRAMLGWHTAERPA